MFTGKPQKHRAAATTYFDEHLSHNDYYTQTQTQAGQWIGVGCERLGLQQGEVVTRDAFLKLCDNLHPDTGQQLTQTTIKDRRIFFDFQCAPPKSVSILAVTMNDRRIIEAHKEASTLALRELERFAATRIRKGGIEDKDRITGNLVGAAFMHTSSRALDPQLHTHFVLFNCTWDKTEQRWKALQTSGMFDAIHYGTEVYRNELVKRLQGIGYKIRHTSSAFEIEGVEPELIERFSKRSKERDAAVAKEQVRLGRKLTKDEVANVVHQTRPKKLKGASDEQVRKQQLGEIGFFEKRALRKVVAGADGRPKEFAQRVGTDEAVAHGLAHVFERNSVAPEQRWKALQTSGMFDAIHYGTEVYRNELVKRLQGIGYKIRHTSSAFEIEGVEPELIERFSKRSKERDAAVAKEQLRLGRKLTKDEVANVVHQTRPKKLKGASDEQVRKQQLGEIGFFEKRALRKVVAGADGRPQDFAQRVGTDEAVEHGLAHVFERNSVAPEHRILEAALVKGRGQLDLAQLKEKLAADDHLVRVGSEYSTRHILSRELALIRTVNAGIEAVAPVTRHYEAPAYLGHDQRKAVAHVLTSPDRVTGFRGLAGSGKSTALAELAHALHRQGFEAVFCAPTASAADTLRRDGLENAMTLEGFYSDLHTRSRLSSRSVVVLDEAGAVGLEAMARLFDLAVRKDFRVVLCGDTGQHSSVTRGDALRILEQYSGYRFEELTTIRRQKPAAFRQVVELAAAKQTDKAFAKLLELGAVTEALTDDGQLYQRAANAYLSATKQGRSALLVSPTWAEIEAVTDKVRDTLKAQGVLGQHEEAVTVFDSLSWTEAQKKNASQFVPGQRLRFIRQTKHFDRGDTVEVVATIQNGLRVRRADGVEVNFIPASVAASFDVGEARELKVSPGDWLLLQANHGKEFINGERVQVREIQNGRIALADGRSLPAGFNAFTHGYAVTSHSSQGKTVDEVLLVASSRSFGAVNREQFYVSISRGRERVHVFTDDADLLARRVTNSHTRKAAVELQALRDGLAKLGFIRTERLEEVLAHGHQPPVVEDSCALRQRRPMRQTRLSTVQRLATAVEDVRRWLDERLGIEQKETVAENVGPAESVKQAESVRQTETVKPARTVREALRHHQAHRQQQRRSGGIHI